MKNFTNSKKKTKAKLKLEHFYQNAETKQEKITTENCNYFNCIMITSVFFFWFGICVCVFGEKKCAKQNIVTTTKTTKQQS